MDYKKTLNKLLTKDLSRKEFLTHAGVAVLTMVGITRLLHSLHESYGSDGAGGKKASAYGGHRSAGKTFSTTNLTRRDG